VPISRPGVKIACLPWSVDQRGRSGRLDGRDPVGMFDVSKSVQQRRVHPGNCPGSARGAGHTCSEYLAGDVRFLSPGRGLTSLLDARAKRDKQGECPPATSAAGGRTRTRRTTKPTTHRVTSYQLKSAKARCGSLALRPRTDMPAGLSSTTHRPPRRFRGCMVPMSTVLHCVIVHEAVRKSGASLMSTRRGSVASRIGLPVARARAIATRCCFPA
jgi:hypothetical protein